MITLRKSEERGHANHGWLDSYHTFSFADYHDPKHMHFRTLRVINEDRVAPGRGFGTHPHRDMEILTYVLEGELEHKDSLGNGSRIVPGEVQYMCAGTGVEHSEFNPSPTTPVHLLQIWIFPASKGLTPRYEQKKFSIVERSESSSSGTQRGLSWVHLASPDGRDGSIKINQDVDLYAAKLLAGQSLAHTLQTGRAAWLQVARGQGLVNGAAVSAGDGVALTEEDEVRVQATSECEILLFNLG